jgi:tetratricopeptide (TPR) repeat protein
MPIAESGNPDNRDSPKMTMGAGDLLGEAMLRHQEGRLVEAEALYRRSLELEPDNAQALRLCGILARERNDLAASLELLGRAAEAAPADARCAGELAISQMDSGDLDSAESSLRYALSRDPESSRALANLGALLQRRGHLQEAISYHRQYLEFESNDVEVRCNLANALLDAGYGQEALEECENALIVAPDHPLILANKGAVLCGLEKFELASRVLERAVAANSDDELALINLGYARSQLQQLEPAAVALRQAVFVNPDSARASADLAAVLMTSGQSLEAIEICEEFLERHPGERLTLATYAFALHDQGREDEARSILNFDELITVIDIDKPPGYGDIADFNDAIAVLIKAHPSIVESPASKSTTGGDQTGELHLGETGDLSILRDLINAAVGQAASQWQGAGFANHPAMAYASDSWVLRVWGVILNEGGFQAPHLHPLGWLSGVYYLQLPPEMESNREKAGWLEFGVPPARLSAVSPPAIHSVEPKAGRLILFPSYFYHRTRPFVSKQPRISIAFDVVPVLPGR